MKKLIQIPVLMFVLILISSCSSNNVGQDDLSISEIEDIEKTGEFSAEDFFSDEDVLADSGVSVDLEGVDSDLDIDDDAELLSDVDFDDFEGENFDESSDFETDFADGSSSEFDEFDEFMTDESIAQNEDFNFDDDSSTAVAGGSENFDIDEDDVFAEFDNMDTGSGSVATNDDFSFEDAFADDFQTQQDIANTETSPSPFDDDLFGEQEQTVAMDNNAFDDVIATTETQPVDSGGATASQLLGSKAYTGVGQTFGMGDAVETVTKQLVPVQKMASHPFRRSGILLNTLYVVRPGDTLASIKDKVYGPGSSANLQQINPTLKANNLKVGEKVYYNSPNRPNDDSRMMLYYDDVGLSAQYHEIRSGQSIRKVAEDLLGHPRSWMEIWATNMDIESKWVVSRAHNLRYFPDGAVAAPVLAQQQPELIEPADEPVSVTTNMNNQTNQEPDFNAGFDDDFAEDNQIAANPGSSGGGMGGEPDFDQNFDNDFDQGYGDQAANNDMGAEPDFDQGFNDNFDDGMDTAMNEQDAAAQAIPENFKNAGTKNLGPFGLDQSMIDTISLGAGGLLIFAGIFFLARKKRKKKEASSVEDFDFAGNTQIDEQTKTRIDL